MGTLRTRNLSEIIRQYPDGVEWKELVGRCVPEIYSYVGLRQQINMMHRNKLLEIDFEHLNIRKHIKRIKMTGTGTVRLNSLKGHFPTAPIAKDPDELPPDIMPCRQRIGLCYHSGCYLRFDCKAHPDYSFRKGESQ